MGRPRSTPRTSSHRVSPRRAGPFPDKSKFSKAANSPGTIVDPDSHMKPKYKHGARVKVPLIVSRPVRNMLIRMAGMRRTTIHELLEQVLDKYVMNERYSPLRPHEVVAYADRMLRATSHLGECTGDPCGCGLNRAINSLDWMLANRIDESYVAPVEPVSREKADSATVYPEFALSWEGEWPEMRPRLHEPAIWEKFLSVLGEARPPAAFLSWLEPQQIEWLNQFAPISPEPYLVLHPPKQPDKEPDKE